GKKKSELSSEDSTVAELVEKISKMNLTDMRTYINNRVLNFEVDEDGLVEVMRRLTTKNSETSKRYIEIDDMDSKIKKGFELVISIASHSKITIVAVEQIQEFMELYSDIITKYDRDHKQIYEIKLKESISKAIVNIGEMTELKRKMSVLGV
ncbi:MAG: hypothetical protein U9Q29_08595, partial [Campylobacterota bacterium]|nr:hypothetical protein [Campylobacterota bacterium]